MRAGFNYIIFETDKLFNDHVRINGRDIYFDPMFDPAKHVRTYGTVVQIPHRLTSIPIMQESNGVPYPIERTPFRYKYIKDIEMEVEVGDKIYFHFNTIIKMRENMIHEFKDKLGTPVRWWFKVRYDQVICAVREGKIIPIGGYTLVEPDMESLDDILIPIAMVGADGKPLRDERGKAILKPMDQWLQTKVQPSAKYMRGWVRHVGTPLKGDICEIEEGQLIYYKPNADWMNVIEGKEFYAIRQKHIVGRVPNN